MSSLEVWYSSTLIPQTASVYTQKVPLSKVAIFLFNKKHKLATIPRYAVMALGGVL